MKKKVALLLVLVLILSMFCMACGKDDGEKTVKIGVFEPATGKNGSGGKQEILGVQYANYKTPTVEIGGVEYKVELVVVDNESSNDKAPTAAQDLVSKGISMVLGTYGSGCAIAAGPTFEQAEVAALGITCTNPQVTLGCDVYYRICFLDPFQGTVLANYAFDSGCKKAYCLSELGDDYSAGLVNYFKEAFTKLGGEVVEEQFPNGNTDFTSYVANAKKNGCDVFFSPGSIEAGVNIIDQADAQNLGMPILASDTWDSNMIGAAAKGKNVDVTVTTFYQEGGSPEFDKGIKAWMESDSTALTNNGGNTEIAAVSAMGYDAYYVALEALKAAGSTDPKEVLKVMPSLKVSGLVCGDVAFDKNGDAAKDSAVVKHVNTETGLFEFVATQKVK